MTFRTFFCRVLRNKINSNCFCCRPLQFLLQFFGVSFENFGISFLWIALQARENIAECSLSLRPCSDVTVSYRSESNRFRYGLFIHYRSKSEQNGTRCSHGKMVSARLTLRSLINQSFLLIDEFAKTCIMYSPTPTDNNITKTISVINACLYINWRSEFSVYKICWVFFRRFDVYVGPIHSSKTLWKTMSMSKRFYHF